MDIFFTDPNDKPLLPEEIRIREFEIKPYPDGRRLAVRFVITPFQQRPNVEVAVFAKNGDLLAEMSVVEIVEPHMTFTLHLPPIELPQTLDGKINLFYTNLEGFDESLENLPTAEEFLSRGKKIIDSKELFIDVTAEETA